MGEVFPDEARCNICSCQFSCLFPGSLTAGPDVTKMNYTLLLFRMLFCNGSLTVGLTWTVECGLQHVTDVLRH
jgi:hypothetical protein